MKLSAPPSRLVLIGEAGSPYLERVLQLELPIRVTVIDSRELARHAPVLADADSMLFWKCPADARETLFNLAPNIRWMHTHSAGVESLPLDLLRERGVVLTNAAGIFANPLAEFAIAGILSFARDIPRLMRQQRAGEWKQFDVTEVSGKTAVIVGYGGIGRAVAERLKGMRVRVIACRNRPEPDPLVDLFVRPADLSGVLPEADYLIITAPITDQTRGMIGEAELRLMKRSAVLINIGRGPVVVEGALVAALEAGALHGAALDVFDVEPLPTGHPFYRLENVLLSPHSADHTEMWLWDTLNFFVEQLRSVLGGGELRNVVDFARGY